MVIMWSSRSCDYIRIYIHSVMYGEHIIHEHIRTFAMYVISPKCISYL